MNKEMLLDKFIQNRLTEAERKEFDRLYTADENFKTDVEFHTNIARVAEAEDDDTFRKMMSDFESEVQIETAGDAHFSATPPALEREAKSERTIVKRLPTKWLIAASIALIAGLTYFFIPESAHTSQELFTQNFEPFPNVVHPIVRGEKGPEPMTMAFLAYENGEYATAIALFTDLYTETKEPDYLFYQANALLQLNRGREAIPLLQNHLKTNDTLTEKSDWYLAMAYLQIDNRENARKMLQTVVDDGVFKVKEAKKLLKSLEKLSPE